MFKKKYPLSKTWVERFSFCEVGSLGVVFVFLSHKLMMFFLISGEILLR